MDQLEALLLDSVSEEADRARTAVSTFDELQKKDPTSLFNAFSAVILESNNPKAVTLAIINLSTLVTASYTELVETKQQEVTTTLLAIYQHLADHDIRYFAHLCVSVLSQFTGNNEVMLGVFGVFETTSQKGLRCTLELLAGLEFMPTHELMSLWFQELLKVTLAALQSETTYYKSLAVRAVAMLLAILPDQVDKMSEHLDLIKGEMKNSLQMTQQEFEWFWKACDRLFATDAVSFEEMTDGGYLELIMSATKREDLVPRLRVLPLHCLNLVFPYMEIADIRTISKFSQDMAALYWRQTHELPFHLIFFYERLFDEFTHSGIFQMMREMINEAMESDDKSLHIVGLCAMKVLMEKIPNYVYTVVGEISAHIETALKSSDPSFIEAGCELLSVFPEIFAKNLADLGQFFPWLVSYMVHPNPSVRFIASEAAYRTLAISRVPCVKAVWMMFQIMDKVDEDDQLRYLSVFAKAIEGQIMVEQDEAMQVVQMVQKLVENTTNDDYLIGALTVAVKVMRYAECTREALLPIVVELINKGLASDNNYAISACASSLGELLKVDSQMSLKLFTHHKNKLEEIISWDEKYTQMKQQVLIYLAHVNAVVGDHPLSDKLFDIAVTWLKSQVPDEVISALRMLKRGVLYRPEHQIVSVFRAMAEVCCSTKEMSVACMSVTCMGYMIKNAKGEAKVQCTEIGYQMAIKYFLGELLVLNHIPPLSTDIDLSLMLAFAKETSQLLVSPNDAQRTIFQFSVGVVARQNSIKTELVFYLWTEAVKCNTFLPDEVQYIKDTALSYVVPDLAPELIMSVCYLLTSLVNANLIDWETMQPKFSVIKSWWNRGCELKHKARTTMTSILTLILTIMGNYDSVMDKSDPIILETILQQFPPDDVKHTGQVTEILIKIFDRQNIAPRVVLAGVKAMTRLLDCSPAALVKRKVTAEMTERLRTIVKNLCDQNDAAI